MLMPLIHSTHLSRLRYLPVTLIASMAQVGPENMENMNNMGAGGPFQGYQPDGVHEEFQDLFEAFFGGGRQTKRRGADLRVAVRLTFMVSSGTILAGSL